MPVTKVEKDEIVIRIPVSALCGVSDLGFVVRDATLFAPHVAREISGEDMGERLWIEPLVEDAMIRAAESDAPGIIWDDASAEGQALYENDRET